ncbi:MAG TPA: hypothetical protein VGI05_23605 [Streptosporangiaceae bacterium]|jgi:hypothetical protein
MRKLLIGVAVTLPLHLRLTSVHVTPDGLRIAASARHVQSARG